MKKIVSVWAIAALTLSAVFAADISIEYTTAGNVYSATKTKTSDGTVTSSNKTVLDQTGYDGASSCFVLSATSDVGGFVLDIDPDAENSTNYLDQWYAWVNFGNLQTTVGLWESRYVNRVKADANNWASVDYERYKPGVIDGAYANDIDNLTYNTAEDHQKLSTALAYTIRPSDDVYLMIKGVLVNADNTSKSWGGAVMNSDSGNYTNYFFSGFAGEIAFKANGLFDINFALRSEKRNALGAGIFIRPLMFENLNLLVGFSYGADLSDKKRLVDSDDTEKTEFDRNYFEYALDLRARIKLTDSLAITTMNNLSSFNLETVKDAKDKNLIKLWDMVSLAYDVTEQLQFQFTVESECGVFATDGVTDYSVGDLGGFDLSFIPGVTWTFNENASLTAGLKFETSNVGASSAYKDAYGSTTSFSIPVVIDIAL